MRAYYLTAVTFQQMLSGVHGINSTSNQFNTFCRVTMTNDCVKSIVKFGEAKYANIIAQKLCYYVSDCEVS